MRELLTYLIATKICCNKNPSKSINKKSINKMKIVKTNIIEFKIYLLSKWMNKSNNNNNRIYKMEKWKKRKMASKYSNNFMMIKWNNNHKNKKMSLNKIKHSKM